MKRQWQRGIFVSKRQIRGKRDQTYTEIGEGTQRRATGICSFVVLGRFPVGSFLSFFLLDFLSTVPSSSLSHSRRSIRLVRTSRVSFPFSFLGNTRNIGLRRDTDRVDTSQDMGYYCHSYLPRLNRGNDTVRLFYPVCTLYTIHGTQYTAESTRYMAQSIPRDRNFFKSQTFR